MSSDDTKRDSGSLPPEVKIEIKKKRKEDDYNNMWRSCCCGMLCDKRLVEYITQCAVGIGIIIFCAVQLTNADCETAPPYWGLIGSTVGFFLKSGMIRDQQKK
jgi:hypothetical protein